MAGEDPAEARRIVLEDGDQLTTVLEDRTLRSR
jgi:hypothetical protein